MKKLLVTLSLMLIIVSVFAQQKTYTGKVYDGITYEPLSGASIYNMNTQKFVFTDKNGTFTIKLSLNDTLVISKSIYRQLVVEVDKRIFNGIEDFFLYYKATMLKEVRIIAINPSYEGFKKDIVTLELPDYYKRVEEIKLDEFQIANATYKPDGNLFAMGGKMTTSPISYIYDKYSRKSRMDRLYNEMISYEDEIDRIQDKYNREIVGNLTGLQGDELMNFMMYCRFGYYDLVRMSDEEIRSKIMSKFYEYQYNNIQSGEKQENNQEEEINFKVKE